jgi:hypothetical protein
LNQIHLPAAGLLLDVIRAIAVLGDNEPVAATRNEDMIAVDIYRRAEESGEPITLGTVERRLSELLAHEPGCPCGLCTAAASVRPQGVWWIVRAWVGGVNATRRRARR